MVAQNAFKSGEGRALFLGGRSGRKGVASSDIDVLRGNGKHVGVLGIVVERGFRDLGIGTEMMKILVEQAMNLGLKVLTLQAYATNRRAVHVYEKLGFVQTGRVPKKYFKEGQYVDEVIMTKLVE